MGVLPLVLFLLLVASVRAQIAAPAPDLKENPPPASATLNAALPSILIAGDSTAARGRGATQQGWGVPFADYFDAGKVNIVNRARGGRSSRTYLTEGLWEQLLTLVKPGDLVLIQFGHNDGGAINDEPPPPLRARGSLPGLGEETRIIDNVLTRKTEVVHTYGWYLRKMIAETRAKGAQPVVLSLTLRNRWSEGKIERGSGRYGEWAAAVAAETGTPFLDLTTAMADRFDAAGESAVTALYPQDHTHFNAEGADRHAREVVRGLISLLPARVTPLLSTPGTALVP